MKKKIILMLTIAIALACAFVMSVSASELFTLTDSVDDRMVGDTLALTADSEGLVWYLDEQNKLVSVKASELTLEYEAQTQPYTQIGRLPQVAGAQCLKAIKVGDTVIQSMDVKKIVVANLSTLSFEYLYSDGTTLFSNSTLLQAIYLPDTVKRLAEGSFMGCEALTDIDMGDNVQIVWDKVFMGATKLERIDFSNTCLYIGNDVFSGCSSLKEVRLGSSMQHLTNQFMRGTGEQRINLYIPTTITYFGAPYNNFLTIFLTGTYEQALSMLPTFNVVKYTYISYEEYDGLHTDELLKWYAYYDVSLCDAFYNGEHMYEEDGVCLTDVVCQRCSAVVAKAQSEHSIKTEIAYAQGFLKNGIKSVFCANEGCTYGTTEELFPLFGCLGYSASEGGNVGLAIGFTVNNKAISEYEVITGKTVKYGVFAVLQSKIKDKAIFDESGKAAEGVVSAEIANHETSVFELKVFGFTDDQKDIKLAMGAYAEIVANVGETVASEYSYMQDGTPSIGEKYYFASYNDRVLSLSSVAQ